MMKNTNNIIRHLSLCLFLLLCSMNVVLAQERLNEFVVEFDETHNPMAIYANYGARTNDGVVIINSAIPDLEFGIMSVAKERLRKVVPDKGKNRYLLIIQPNDSNYKQYTITLNAKGFKQGKIESVVVKAGLSTGYIVNPNDNSMQSNTIGGHEFVDLGLPSGTMWATCNVGAQSPEECGNYYAWGEIQTKTIYYFTTYKHCNKSSFKSTKYCNRYDYGDNGFIDNLNILQASDDPATTWGTGWHTPSKEQWDELLKNTTSHWTTRNGMVGRIFTAKNGKTLFLPAAGVRFYENLESYGSKGYYWSLSLVVRNPDEAWCLAFDSNNCDTEGLYRIVGIIVRPVFSILK